MQEINYKIQLCTHERTKTIFSTEIIIILSFMKILLSFAD